MDYGAKSMAANTSANVDINFDMDEVLKRIQTSRNVAGVMVINNEGIPLKSTLDSSTTVNHGYRFETFKLGNVWKRGEMSRSSESAG